MAQPFKNPYFWDILNALVNGVPVKQITHQFKVGSASLARYRDECLETVVRIKDNVVDANQLTFSFMHDPLRYRRNDFQPRREGTFYKRWDTRD